MAHEYVGHACPQNTETVLSGSARAAIGASKSSAVMVPLTNASKAHFRAVVSAVHLHEREQNT